MAYSKNNIVIVGGGSAGWLTAAGFSKYFTNSNITLIESKKIPTIGVGESTTTLMKSFINDHLGISDKQFIRGTDAIYKLSVKFNDFYYKNDGGFHYPFGYPVTNKLDPFKEEAWQLIKYFYPETPRTDYVESLIPAYHLFSKNKIADNFDTFDLKNNSAYHLDANKLGPFLRDEFCLPRGVNHIYGEVSSISKRKNGIEFLTLQDGQKIYGDFFIDCTGFKKLLINSICESNTFVDVSHKLPNNKAWATPIQYKDKEVEMTPYTSCTALENGWAWYTPIWSRIGNGYAYSDKYIDAENALNEFKNYLYSSQYIPINLSKKEIDNLPFFELKMTAGYNKESFYKNVCSIGLSAGFLEPLEGTGLYFITESILLLVKLLSREKFNQYNIDSYNMKMSMMYEDWTDILSIFYAYSVRDDSEYWKEISTKTFDKRILDPTFNSSMYGGLQEYALSSINDHGSLRSGTNVRANDFISIGYDMSMDITEETINKWKSDVNYKQLSDQYKIILQNNKNRWNLESEKHLSVFKYITKEIFDE
jgi:tryptophan halogenase